MRLLTGSRAIGLEAVGPDAARQEAGELVTGSVHIMSRAGTVLVETSVERERQRTVLHAHRRPQLAYSPQSLCRPSDRRTETYVGCVVAPCTTDTSSLGARCRLGHGAISTTQQGR